MTGLSIKGAAVKPQEGSPSGLIASGQAASDRSDRRKEVGGLALARLLRAIGKWRTAIEAEGNMIEIVAAMNAVHGARGITDDHALLTHPSPNLETTDHRTDGTPSTNGGIATTDIVRDITMSDGKGGGVATRPMKAVPTRVIVSGRTSITGIADISTRDRDRDRSAERRRRDSDRHRERDKDRRSRRDSDHKEKRSKLFKDAPTSDSATRGKYGIITDKDITLKAAEFRVWLIEERRLNPERISKDKRKREFSRFVETHNSASFPHDKFYNMAAYDRRMAMIRNGDTLAPETSTKEEKDEWDKRHLTYNFEQDERAHLAKIRASHVPLEAELTKEEIIELRRIEKERLEISQMRRLGMEIPRSMGVRMEEVVRESVADMERFHS